MFYVSHKKRPRFLRGVGCLLATVRAEPFAVAVSRRFAHIADGGRRGLVGFVRFWQFGPGDDGVVVVLEPAKAVIANQTRDSDAILAVTDQESDKHIDVLFGENTFPHAIWVIVEKIKEICMLCSVVKNGLDRMPHGFWLGYDSLPRAESFYFSY